MSTEPLVTVWLVALPMEKRDWRRSTEIADRLLRDLPAPLQSTVPHARKIEPWESRNVARDPDTHEPTHRALMLSFVADVDLMLAESWHPNRVDSRRAEYALDLEKQGGFEEIVRQEGMSISDRSIVMWVPQEVLVRYYPHALPYAVLKATFHPDRIGYNGFESLENV